MEYNQTDYILLLSIFPEEIWSLIANKILADSPTTLESIINSSTFFRSLLFYNRVLFLFEKVFRLIICKALSKTTVNGNTRRYRNNSVVLSYRLVCSTWNKAVDSHLRNKKFVKSLMKLDYLNNIERVALEVASNQMFSSVGENRLELFLNHFDKTHSSTSLLADSAKTRSPFLGRKASILYYQANDANRQFSRNISILLQKYGKHVLYFNLRTDMDFGEFQVCKQIRQWFTYMPDIVSLELSTVNSDDESKLGNQVACWKLPNFSNLQVLKTSGISDEMLNEIVQNNFDSLSKFRLS